jgi:hypothetical protein
VTVVEKYSAEKVREIAQSLGGLVAGRKQVWRHGVETNNKLQNYVIY